MLDNTRGAHDRGDMRRESGGQSLVEFALIVPVLLLLALIAVDFGRIYLGYVNLQNLARIASNFAANNPDAWFNSDAAAMTEYKNLVLNDAANTNCKLTPDPLNPAVPTFTDANSDGNPRGIGDNAIVTFTCGFKVITPIISNILGGTVNVTTTAVFPVKSAISGSSSGGSCLPTATITASTNSGPAPLTVTFTGSGGAGINSWSWAFGDGTTSTFQNPPAKVYANPGTYEATLTVTNVCGSFTTNPGKTITVTPAPTPALCTVPSLSGINYKNADDTWGLPKPPGAGFTTSVQKMSGAPPGQNWTITSQSIVANSSVPCTSTIQVSG